MMWQGSMPAVRTSNCSDRFLQLAEVPCAQLALMGAGENLVVIDLVQASDLMSHPWQDCSWQTRLAFQVPPACFHHMIWHRLARMLDLVS